jgi:type II secretory pathway pseudopilin PulG
MRKIRQSRGFSLIEVIIAAGIFAGTVAVIVALLAALVRQTAEAAESLAARRLPDAVQVELERLATRGFENLAGQIPLMASPLNDGLPLVAARDVADVQSLTYQRPAAGRISPDEQYYLIECWRFSDEPLRFDAAKAFLALHVRVSWPYRLPGSAVPVASANRSELTFAVSINR